MCNSFSLKYFFITAFICFASIFSFSQERMVVFETKVINKEKKAIRNVKVTLYEDSKELVSGKTPKDGYFSFELDLEKKYLIKLSHPDYFDKNISINTDVPPKKMKRYFYIEYDTKMVEKTGNIENDSFFSEAHRVLSYNDVIEEIENNLSHERKMDKKLDELIKGEKKIQEELEILFSTIKNYLDDKNYKEAEKYLKEAETIAPKDIRIGKYKTEVDNIKVELLLVDAKKYANQKRYRRANKLIEEAEKINSENPEIGKLKEEIKEAIEQDRIEAEEKEKDEDEIVEIDSSLFAENTIDTNNIDKEKTNTTEGVKVKDITKDSAFIAKKEELEKEAIKEEINTKSEIVEEQKLNLEEAQKRKEEESINREITDNIYSEIIKKRNRGSGEELFLNIKEISIKPIKYPIISEEVEESYFLDVTTTIIIMPNEEIILHKYDYTFGGTYYFIKTIEVEKDDYNHELEKYFRKK